MPFPYKNKAPSKSFLRGLYNKNRLLTASNSDLRFQENVTPPDILHTFLSACEAD